MDLLEPALVRRWARGQRERDAVLVEIASDRNVEIDRVFVVEVGSKLAVKIKPRQMTLPGVR